MWSVRRWIRSRPQLARFASSGVRLIPDVSITRDVSHVGRLSFGLRRHRWLLSRDCFEGHRPVLGMFQRLIQPEDVVYDVGANIGYYARFALAHFPVSRWIAFEPMSENVRLLRRNLTAHADRTQVLPVAVGDRDGSESLQVDDFSSGAAVLDRISGGKPAPGRERLGLPGKTERVEMFTLDTLVAREKLPPPNVIKIDTEGAEVEVLQGAGETLRLNKPRLLIALHGTERAAQCLRMLDRLGYASFGFTTSERGPQYGRLHDANGVSLADNNIMSSVNPAELVSPLVPLPLA